MTLVRRPDPDAARLASLDGAKTTAMSSSKFTVGIHRDELEWPSTWIDRLA